jgi:hypothetical protein
MGLVLMLCSAKDVDAIQHNVNIIPDTVRLVNDEIITIFSLI